MITSASMFANKHMTDNNKFEAIFLMFLMY